MKTIINGIQSWTKKEIKEEVDKIPVVHSNWNEKNTNSFSHIKNRPFYDDSDRIIVYEAKNITWNTRSISNDYVRAVTEYYYKTPYIDLIPNKEYGILIDGKEYIGVAEDYLADGIWIYMRTDTGSVFEIINYGHIGYNDYGNTGRPDVNFIIFEKTSKTKSINVKFLPQDLLKSMEEIARTLNKKMAYTNPVGTGSLSIGRKNNTTIGTNSVAVGSETTASGYYSYAEGCNTQATTDTSATTTATTSTNTGYAAHAEGYGTVASGAVSHAEGNGTKSSGSYSHSEGCGTVASGHYSHAEGYNTTASGIASHAEGEGTIATDNHSHVEGKYNQRRRYYLKLTDAEEISLSPMTYYQYSYEYTFNANTGIFSLVNSKKDSPNGFNKFPCYVSVGNAWYKIIDDCGDATVSSFTAMKIDISYIEYAHIVGNGTSDTDRSNAHTLDWNGNAWYAGTVEGTAMIVTSSTEGSTKRFKITVDDSGIITATEVT